LTGKTVQFLDEGLETNDIVGAVEELEGVVGEGIVTLFPSSLRFRGS
jgi:hypothetical protein